MNRNALPVVIAGMHRSGTSLTASLLSALSVNIGRHLLPQDANNRRGYFEDVEFLELQRKILSACCAQDDGGHPDWGWTESESLDRDGFKTFLPEAKSLLAKRANSKSLWGWKDPRTTLLLDFWDDLLQDARYVLVYRFPWDVADSMQRLGAGVFLKNPDYAYRIWLFYNRHIRDFYRRHADRCLLVCSNALPGSLEEFKHLLKNKLGLKTGDAKLENIYEGDLLKITGGSDPLMDLAAVAWPDCTRLLTELDEQADISGASFWQVRPVRSRLIRPDTPISDGSAIPLSVITPCYNQGTSLIEAIASAERFAPPNCELILVNDGSQQPKTLEILEALKRCGYFIIDQQNQGLSAARNRAIGLSRGRYLLPLDDDNRIHANFIEDAIGILDDHPDVGVVYGDRYDFGLRKGAQHVPEFDLNKIMERNYIDACAVYRKQVWQDCGGYDSEVSPMEDWELWIHAAALGWQFHRLPYATFDYRIRPDSLIAHIATDEILADYHNKIRNKHSKLYLKQADKQIENLKQVLAERAYDCSRQNEAPFLQTSQLDLMQAQLTERDQEIQTLTLEVQSLKAQIASRDAQIAQMTSSMGWRLLSYYGRIKYKYLLPIYRLLGANSPEIDKDPENSHSLPERETSYSHNPVQVKSLSDLMAGARLASGPKIIGATGGSGTRVFARIARQAGMFIGDHLNEFEDAIYIGLYLDRWIPPFVIQHSSPMPPETHNQMVMDLKMALDMHCEALNADTHNWGWKHPRSIYLLPFFHAQFPALKFLHVVRDGRDMAFSTNQYQLLDFGPIMLDDEAQQWEQPLRSIALWSRVNLMAAEYGERQMGSNYLRVRFEDLCAEPIDVVRQVLNFFDLEGDAKQIAKDNIAPPASLGRWRDQDQETVKLLQEIGSKALEKFGYNLSE